MSAAERFRPGTILSLWDMLRIYADQFVFITNVLASLPHELNKYPADPMFVLTDNDGLLGPGLRGLVGICTELEMPVSRRDAEALLNMFERNEARPAAIVATVVSTLCASIAAELEGRLVIAIGMSGAKLFKPAAPVFGTNVANGFGSAAYEIDEAAKCLALDRSTASVFHLMRLLEVGIKASGASLGIPDPIKEADRNWGAMLRKIKDEIEHRNKEIPPRWNNPNNKDFFNEVYASLDAVRNAWRNPVVHVEGKYTVEEANHIFSAVGGFMRKLSLRVDETGQPLA